MICQLCNSPEIKILYRIKNSLTDFKNLPVTLTILKCKNCGYIFQDYVIKYEYLKEVYDIYTNNLCCTYLECRNEYEKGFRNKVSRILNYKKTGRLLDIGCGYGYFLNMIQAEGWEAEGIDISESAVRYAKDTFGLKVKTSFLEEAAFPDSYFDVVTAWDVIEHIINAKEFLMEINRILKKDGLLCLETPNVNGLLFKIAHILYRGSFNKIDFALRGLFYPLHLTYFNSNTMAFLLNKAGFKIKKLYKKESNLNIIFTEDKKEGYVQSAGIKLCIKLVSLISKTLKMGNKIVIYGVKNECVIDDPS